MDTCAQRARRFVTGITDYRLLRPGSRLVNSQGGIMVERNLSKIALVVALLAGAAQILPTVGGGPDWGMIGNDSTNSRNQPLEHDISPATVHGLAQKWVATTKGDVSATPAVVNGAVYFGDFGGMLWKLDSKTGDVIWSHSVSD